MKLENLSIQDLQYGFEELKNNGGYRCISCGHVMVEGEIYPMQGRFFTGRLAMENHVQWNHPYYLENLIQNESKYNMLTDKQKQLLLFFASGDGDKEISRKMNVSESTIRHQKFTFKEKAKQAKLYLAIYEKVFEKKLGKEELVQVHDSATMLDERYESTNKEEAEIIKNAFSSQEPLKLKIFPRKEKKKIVILSKIAREFEHGRKYTEKEVNEILGSIYEDFATIRRYLIEYGYMAREKDCSLYWLKNMLT